MRYEAVGCEVYDREMDSVVNEADTEYVAKRRADKLNEQERSEKETDQMMRSNRSLCG